MKQLTTLKWYLLTLLFVSPQILAQRQGFGELASTLFLDAEAIRKLVRAICIITGVCFILGSIIQYKKYRNNPTEVRLSAPITSLIIGLVLIALAFIPLQFSQGA